MVGDQWSWSCKLNSTVQSAAYLNSKGALCLNMYVLSEKKISRNCWWWAPSCSIFRGQQQVKIAYFRPMLIRLCGHYAPKLSAWVPLQLSGEPSGVAVTPDNEIVVADTNNHHIQVFYQEGNFKFQFGEVTFVLTNAGSKNTFLGGKERWAAVVS